MKILFLAISMLVASAGNHKLTGRWETKRSEKGNVTGVVFKPDNRLEGYVNKKPFVSGTYSFNPADSIISFIDNGCDGKRGIYKIMFYSSADSLTFKVISDSCIERSEGMQRLVMGRVK